MTFTYRLNEKLMTLEELVNKYPDIWCETLKQEIHHEERKPFNLIIEEAATELFEDFLFLDGISVDFIEKTDIYYDYEVLVGQFL